MRIKTAFNTILVNMVLILGLGASSAQGFIEPPSLTKSGPVALWGREIQEQHRMEIRIIKDHRTRINAIAVTSRSGTVEVKTKRWDDEGNTGKDVIFVALPLDRVDVSHGVTLRLFSGKKKVGTYRLHSRLPYGDDYVNTYVEVQE